MATTVGRDARSTDGGDSNAGKRVVTIGITATGMGLLTATMRSQEITVTILRQDITVTTCRVIRADRVAYWGFYDPIVQDAFLEVKNKTLVELHTGASNRLRKKADSSPLAAYVEWR